MFGARGRLSGEFFATLRWSRWMRFSERLADKAQIATADDVARV